MTNARWYDPALGRFIQPDTIVPDPGNPMDWDRYAYVRNNSVKYIDPSGHAQICADGDPCESAFQGPAKESITASGKQIYNLYVRYNTTKGWWNDNGTSQLTVEKFLGMMILIEVDSQHSQAILMAEVVGHQLWVDDEKRMSRPAWCKGDTCVLGVFNWLGAYSQSARNRVDPHSDWKTPPNNPSLELSKEAEYYGQMSLFAPDDYRKYDGDSPLHWGNRRDIWNASEGRNIGPLIADVYYRADSGYFTIYSWNQYRDMGFTK